MVFFFWGYCLDYFLNGVINVFVWVLWYEFFDNGVEVMGFVFGVVFGIFNDLNLWII